MAGWISTQLSVGHDYIADKPRGPSLQLNAMIRKLPSGKYRLYSRKKNPRTGRRRNLGTFSTRAAAAKHEREIQYFKKA